VSHTARACPEDAFLFDQGSDAADLEGTTNLVEGVAVITHYLAGLGHVAEFFGQLQQGQFPLGTLRERSHLGLLPQISPGMK